MPSRFVLSASTAPPAGLTKPLRTLNRVVLPAPFGPTRPQTPDGSSSETPSSGLTPPNATVSSRTRSMARLRPPVSTADHRRQTLQLPGHPLGSRAHGVHEAEAEDHEDQIPVDADVR